jgi:hypothetical protein
LLRFGKWFSSSSGQTWRQRLRDDGIKILCWCFNLIFNFNFSRT